MLKKFSYQKYTDNNQRVIIEGIERTIDIVEQQSEKGDIAGLVKFSGMTKREDYTDIDEWIYDSRVI